MNKNLTPLGMLIDTYRRKEKTPYYLIACCMNIEPSRLSKIIHGEILLPVDLVKPLKFLCKFNQDEMRIVRAATRENNVEE